MEEAWYRKRDARFECARCGRCCSGAPGFVFLSKQDVERLLEGLRLEFRVFLRDYCTLVDAGDAKVLSLRETKRIKDGALSHDCVLLGAAGCSAYAHRPEQCRSYPFWFGVIDDETSWNDEAKGCPGIGHGPRADPDTIEDLLWLARAHPHVRIPRWLDKEHIDEIAVLGSPGLHPDAGESAPDAKPDLLDSATDTARRP